MVEQLADASPDGLDAAFVSLSQQGLELGEHLLDGVQVGPVGRQEQQVGAGVADGTPQATPLWLLTLSSTMMSHERNELAVDGYRDDIPGLPTDELS